jgi:hypothetical protein
MDCTGHVPCVVLRFLAHWVAIEDSIQEIQDLREPAVCRGRRKKIQINDDESWVTNQEASVNIEQNLGPNSWFFYWFSEEFWFV